MRVTSGNTQHGDGTFSTPVQIGDGDVVAGYVLRVPTMLNVSYGTSTSPDRSPYAIARVSRTLEISSANFTGDGVDACSAFVGVCTGTANNDGQTVGVTGFAKNQSVNPASSGGDDACGLYGVGNVIGSGTGTGIGAFLNGRRETDTGLANGAEIVSDNETGTPGSYNASGFSDTTGIWCRANGDSDSGAGMVIGNPAGVQFKVGYAINGQNTGGKVGGVADAGWRTDGSETTVFDVNGTHTTGFDTSGATISGDAILLAATHKIRFGSSGPLVTSNAGSPEGAVTAPLGSYCADSTNGEGYIKKSGTGNTGWKLVTHA